MNHHELSALIGEDEFLFKLYIVAISRYMDFKTGLVGIKRGISWQSLCEEMYIEPARSIQNSGTPHKSKIRRAVNRLERIGLIINKTKGKRLIFELPLATRDKSVRKEADTKSTHQADTYTDIDHLQFNLKESSNYESYPHKDDIEADIGKTQEADTPHYITNKHIKNKEVFIYNVCDENLTNRFEDFWVQYPRKENKKKARDIWKRKKLDEQADVIIGDVISRKSKHEPWLAGFVPHATTYLIGERWEDEIRETSHDTRKRIAEQDDSILRVLKHKTYFGH